MGGGGLGGPGMPPSPALLRYKPLLLALSGGYAAVIVAGLASGRSSAMSNVLSYIFVLVVSLLMAVRSEQCMSQCVMPFALFTIMTVFLDVVNVIALLSTSYPGPGSLFSTSCPQNATIILHQNTTVYIKDAAVPGAYIVPADTRVEVPQDACDWQWVLANLAQILGILLDILAAWLGTKMLRAAMAAAAEGGDGPSFPMMGGGGGFAGGQPGFPGMGPGGPGGQGGPGGPGQEMGANGRQLQQHGGAGGQPAGGAGGFQPFQGSGQSLNN